MNSKPSIDIQLAPLASRVDPESWGFAPHVIKTEISIIREMLKYSTQPGFISFAGGLPAPEMFPLDDIEESCRRILAKYKSDALQYSLSMGVLQLREAVASRAAMRGIAATAKNILITSGGQQALDMIARAFVTPGETIITEYPTYVGAIQAFNFYEARYAIVKMDNDGMLVDGLEEVIKRHNPKLIYVVTTYQNPSGITMSLERRHRLVAIAAKYNVPIVDDDPYGELHFEGQPVTSLKAINPDIVIQVGTFSKILAPGLRVGWINGPEKIMPIFEKVKQACDLHANTFTQYLTHDFLERGLLDPHIDKIRGDYRQKRDVMIAAIREHFPSSITHTHPSGGLFLWCELPQGVDAWDLLVKAIDAKVTYVIGKAFHPDGGGRNTFRLNFSNANHETIREGIKRLGKVFQKHLPQL